LVIALVGEATDDMCTFMCITVLATCMICEQICNTLNLEY